MPNISGLVRRIKPSITADGNYTPTRADRYGGLFVTPVTQGIYPLADEGSYFKAINAVPGTAVGAAITTAYSATAATFHLRNNDTVGGTNRRIYMDYISIICATVPASSTSMQLVITIDNPATTRYSSGGVAVTPVNCNMDDTTASIGVLHFGAVVLTAASGSARLVSRGVLKAAIPAVNDSFFIQFGTAESTTGPLTGTGVFTDNVGPIILGPQQDLNVHLYWPANATTPAALEFEAGWWER